jgi:hypothetical protein
VCKHDESGITCTWDKLDIGKVKTVTVTANATTSGVQPSIAAVTTSSLDTDPTNNKAAFDVSVLVSAGRSLNAVLLVAQCGISVPSSAIEYSSQVLRSVLAQINRRGSMHWHHSPHTVCAQ